jgi:hypothetical protein
MACHSPTAGPGSGNNFIASDILTPLRCPLISAAFEYATGFEAANACDVTTHNLANNPVDGRGLTGAPAADCERGLIHYCL